MTDTDNIVTVLSVQDALGEHPVGVWVDPDLRVHIFRGKFAADGSAEYGFEICSFMAQELLTLAAAAYNVVVFNRALIELRKYAEDLD